MQGNGVLMKTINEIMLIVKNYQEGFWATLPKSTSLAS
jgi:hypothetical protein